MIKSIAKRTVDTLVPDSELLRYLSYRPRFVKWKSRQACPLFETRFKLYQHLINHRCHSQGNVSYLEFGVFRGETIKWWAENLSANDAKFYGFDTFTGLPEEWIDGTRTVDKSHFSTAGQIPQMSDARVAFVPGLFQESLPTFLNEFDRRELLIVHNDSDLYSATLYVLATLHSHFRPGDIIIFDEFYSVLHEFRAFWDYRQSFMRKWKPIGATNNYVQVAFEMIE